MTTFFYLHGWASSPQSNKARFFKQCFEQHRINLQLPDLNQNDFFHLTLTRQIRQVETLLPPTPVTLIGSSLGGLTALWIAEQQPQVQRLILLAPALNFLANSLTIIGEAKYAQWCHQGETAFYHYGEERDLLLSYDFIQDMYHYDDADLQRRLPTLILHGRQDEVIPVQTSREFITTRPWIQLVEVESDHSLASVQAQLWQIIQEFCQT
jgi:hypothetical protein